MSRAKTPMRVVFVQNGDFREAVERFAAGGGPTYHSQEYSVGIVERMAAQTELTAIICINSAAPHDTKLASGVRSIGLPCIWKRKPPFRPVLNHLEALSPTHLVLRMPSIELLDWARRRGVRVLPCFADSFEPRPGFRGLVDRFRQRRLARSLDHPSVDRIGNHNIAAAESLAAIGINADKIVPWDWPRSPVPKDFPAKSAPRPGRKQLVYVGSVSEQKGVGDVLRALAADPAMGEGATLDVVGAGDIDGMKALAASLGLAARVRFAGRVPHAEVASRMHNADAVLVYSRHEYGEGLPGTIYLGLASRTPLVISDHPMFVAYMQDGRDAVIVPQRSPAKLASRLQALFDDSAVYSALSAHSAEAFAHISHPVLWGDLISRWLADGPEDRLWMEAQALPHWRKKP